jgi:GAF domain-containing protein
MYTWIRQFLAPPVFEGDEDKTRVARLLHAVLLAFLIMLLAYAAISIVLPNPETILPLVGATIALDLGAWLLMRRGRVQPAGLLFLAVVWALVTVAAFFYGGLAGPTFFAAVVIVVAAGLLLGEWGGFLFAGLSIAAGIGLLWAESSSLLPPAPGANPPTVRLVSLTLYVVLAAVILRIAARSLNEALREARRYADELEEERAHLEETVKERTQDLTRRTRYLEATAATARDTSVVLDLQELLSRTVDLVSEQFGFYHAGLFLLDDSGEWAVLQAASSEGGLRMLRRSHRLRLGTGIVGTAVAQGQPRIALDVGEDAVFFDNPDLPETRSEMALPLRARGEAIGALDVQSRKARAFSEEDVAVLQTLADQVAVAISNAQLFQQAQESLEAERRAYGELSRRAWSELLRTQPAGLGVLRDKHGIAPAGTWLDSEVEQALQTGRAATSQDGARNLAVPVRVRGQVIGAIDAHKPVEAREWTPEQIALLETLAEQLGDALEDARLFEDARRRAIREQLTRQITTRIRESLDPDTILKASVQELGRVLGAERVAIEIAGPGGGYGGSTEEGLVTASNGDVASPLGEERAGKEEPDEDT